MRKTLNRCSKTTFNDNKFVSQLDLLVYWTIGRMLDCETCAPLNPLYLFMLNYLHKENDGISTLMYMFVLV